MIKPQILELISRLTPTNAIGDTLCHHLRTWADAWNAKTADLKEQVRLGMRDTLFRLGAYFAQAWRSGKTSIFSFYITKSYLTGELHPKTRAGEKSRNCCVRTIYNHIERLKLAGILAKESMKEDTKCLFDGGWKRIPCLRLTWNAPIITLFRQESSFDLPADAPLTYAEQIAHYEKFLKAGILTNLRT